ncbi:MAG: adenylate/guanylate cyclase domain-containing protein [Cellvibrio sp.]|uniref:adenylate/guanylate cyclase domain-containing protein n=1 Tax=Cellvibrio sp. TaxID=1965322 RepID=UPI0031A83DCC
MVADSIEHCEQTLMFTDIVGYSRLMGRNESLAVEMLGDYRRILLSHIEQQGGQLVEFVGDAIFARFNTAPSAVAAAIAIQQHLLAFNEARDKKLPRLQTRIGLHKGEVMLRDGAVFGDSVNIAARLEPLAVADGICISQTVYDEIRLTLSSPAKRLGLQSLKNIQQKIRVYLIKPVGIGWRDHLHYFLRGLNKNIVAYRYPLTACLLALIAAGVYFIPRWLVPGYAANYVEIADFKNLMNEKGDADYFSAGITEAVRSQLADMRDVYIVDAKEGIHAPIRLEGSVQKLGDNLRIAYRLFRRKDNVQIAGGKLDGTYQDIFILQDRLVGEIARYLSDEFDLQNFRPAPLRLTNDITAYDFYLKGLEFLEKPASHEFIDQGIQQFNTALVHDIKFALANTGLCKAFWKKYELSRKVEWLTEAESYCVKALSQDPNLSSAYEAIATIYIDTRRYDKAIEYLTIAAKNYNHEASIMVDLALAFHLSGDNKKAEDIYLDTISRNSKDWQAPFGYAYFLTMTGRHKEALKYFEDSIALTPENTLALNNIAANYYFLGDFEKAAKYYEISSAIEPSTFVYANIGSMYYLSRKFNMAADFYMKAYRLEPANYQWSAYLADAYKFIPERKEEANRYFNDVINSAQSETGKNIARPYQYIARSLACLGRIGEAKKTIAVANSIESSSAESHYSNLRIAIIENDFESIGKYTSLLLKTEYSESAILNDPDFLLLRDVKFKGLFVN